MSQPGASNALVRKRSDNALMAPPPPKKIKRPRQVLDEDSYTETLSAIIARDFFPGLLETEIKQEYLDALDSKDAAWISSAGRRLENVMTPRRTRAQERLAGTGKPTGQTPDATPMSFAGETPGPVAPPPVEKKLPINMSLSKFQQTYTSEDNESFYKLVDKQNQKRAEKYSWLWRGNKLPSKQMIKQKEVEERLALTQGLVDDGFAKRDRLAIKDVEERPAQADSWNANPKNNFMFGPDGVEDEVKTISQTAEEASRAAPKAIIYENTRIPEPHVPKRPPSPSVSSLRDAVAGRPRPRDQDSHVSGGETPRVNGYAFVDDEDDEPDVPALPVIDLGKGSANNPFKVQGQRKRELLHERMVDRITKSNKESSRNGFTGRIDKTPVPKFPSSPRVGGSPALTPAAQRLWSRMGTPGRTGFGEQTPKKPRGSLLRSVTRRSPKKD